jgi:hypothetical protein
MNSKGRKLAVLLPSPPRHTSPYWAWNRNIANFCIRPNSNFDWLFLPMMFHLHDINSPGRGQCPWRGSKTSIWKGAGIYIMTVRSIDCNLLFYKVQSPNVHVTLLAFGKQAHWFGPKPTLRSPSPLIKPIQRWIRWDTQVPRDSGFSWIKANQWECI